MSDGMPTNDMSPEAARQDHASGPGQRLAAQRERLGWTIEQVARQLNLAPRQIQALEDDNHTALPGAASVRGFIRSYAKLLRIDSEPLLEMMPATVASISEPIPVRRALSKPFSGDRLPVIGERSTPWKTLVLLGIVAALLAGAFIAERAGWLTLHGKFGGTHHRVQVLSTKATPAPREIAPPPAQNNEAMQEEAPPVPLSQPEAASESQPEATSDTTESGSGSNVSPVAAKSGDLVLNFREESWLEAYRLDQNGEGAGTRLEAQLMPAGSTEAFEMKSGPVALVIGNVAGVDITLRGKPVTAKSIGKTNVARLTLK